MVRFALPSVMIIIIIIVAGYQAEIIASLIGKIK